MGPDKPKGQGLKLGLGPVARAAFRFIEEHVAKEIALTGTGPVAHLVQNVRVFRRRHDAPPLLALTARL